jgi:ribosomal protein L37AE/L43A
MNQPDEQEGFLAKRRGTAHNCTQAAFRIFTDTATKPTNLMQNTVYGDELTSFIASIATDGYSVDRSGAWRLDNDQAPVVGGDNTGIQLNNRDGEGNDTGAFKTRNKGGTTSVTCVLVQNGAAGAPGFEQALSEAHALSWEHHCGIILALAVTGAKTGTWSCSKCQRSVAGKAQIKPPLCLDGKKNKSTCKFSHAA